MVQGSHRREHITPFFTAMGCGHFVAQGVSVG
jgi:hypothetical protein